mgnify:CR=1 FL=1
MKYFDEIMIRSTPPISTFTQKEIDIFYLNMDIAIEKAIGAKLLGEVWNASEFLKNSFLLDVFY